MSVRAAPERGTRAVSVGVPLRGHPRASVQRAFLHGELSENGGDHGEAVSKLEVEEEGDNKSRRLGVTQYSTVGGSQWILALN